MVPDLIRAFRAVEPDVEFVLRQALSDTVAQLLSDGEVDVALSSARPPLDEPVGWHELVRERLALAVPPEHRLAKRRRMRLAEAAAEPFVTVRPHSEFRQITDRLCRQAGFTPRIAFESDELSTARALVAAGLGVAIVPVTPLRPVGGPSVALTDPGAGRPLGLAWMTHRQLPGPAEAFRSWLIGYAATEPWRMP
jgi:DNA-binding transcriptional LysR family regulator